MYYDGYYLNIQYVPLPPGSHGASTPNPDGSYTVFLDPNDSTEMQAYGFWKELDGQIKKGHYDNIQDKEADQVELEAHDIEPEQIPQPEAVEAPAEPAKPVWPLEEPEWPDAGPIIDATEFAQTMRYLRILRDNMIRLQVLEELRSLEKEEKKKYRKSRRKKKPEEADLTEEDIDQIRALLGLPGKSWLSK